MSEKLNKNKVNFKVMNFNAVTPPPTMRINKNLNIVEWGTKNDYPQYLINLYADAGSSTHSAIINRKVKFTAGKGFVETSDERLNQFIKDNNLKEHTRRASLDLEVLNGFAFELIYSNDGQGVTSIQHIPLSKIRIAVDDNGDIDDSIVWFSNDWTKYRRDGYEPVAIDTFNPENTNGKQIYVHYNYNLKVDYYTVPTYSNAINWIRTDSEISKFQLNQVSKGFAPDLLLNFATGIPLEEEQVQIYKDFVKTYGGTDGEKLILTFSEGKDQAPMIETIDLNNSDDRFTALEEMMTDNIVVAHEMPTSLIIQTPGKLGGTNERKQLMEEFHQSYTSTQQELLEDVLNELLSINNYTEKLALNNYLETEEESEEEISAKIAFRNSPQGVQTILSIIEQLKGAQIDREIALAMLELSFGYTPEEAERFLPNNNIENTEE